MHRLNPTAIANCYQDAHYDDGHRYDDAIWYEEHMKGDPKGKGWNNKGQAKGKIGQGQDLDQWRQHHLERIQQSQCVTSGCWFLFKWASTMASTMHSTVITTTTDDPLSGTTGRSGLLTTSSSCCTQWIRTER